ncbi:hypothetical protein [Devosia sp.]|uniref:hypothetical protein n=1 Tax=Devosia sp. TaxID=1871048 RepID=UPI00260DDE6B|nr:hypothetical protein [Devosia sp.]
MRHQVVTSDFRDRLGGENEGTLVGKTLAEKVRVRSCGGGTYKSAGDGSRAIGPFVLMAAVIVTLPRIPAPILGRPLLVEPHGGFVAGLPVERGHALVVEDDAAIAPAVLADRVGAYALGAVMTVK